MQQTFTVTGMTCGHCEKAVQQALLQADPKAVVAIDRARNEVRVESDTDRAVLARAIAEEGYSVGEAA